MSEYKSRLNGMGCLVHRGVINMDLIWEVTALRN